MTVENNLKPTLSNSSNIMSLWVRKLTAILTKRRGVVISGFADLANFWFGFSVLVTCAVCGFIPIFKATAH